MSVFQNMVLRRIFGPKRDQVKREWRKLRNEELYDLYCLPNILLVIKSRRVMLHVARVGDKKDAYKILVGKPG